MNGRLSHLNGAGPCKIKGGVVSSMQQQEDEKRSSHGPDQSPPTTSHMISHHVPNTIISHLHSDS